MLSSHKISYEEDSVQSRFGNTIDHVDLHMQHPTIINLLIIFLQSLINQALRFEPFAAFGLLQVMESLYLVFFVCPT